MTVTAVYTYEVCAADIVGSGMGMRDPRSVLDNSDDRVVRQRWVQDILGDAIVGGSLMGDSTLTRAITYTYIVEDEDDARICECENFGDGFFNAEMTEVNDEL